MGIIYVCVILVILFAVFFIFRHKIHPPVIKISSQRGEAFVSLYNGIERCGSYWIYKFTRNRKGKWEYEIEDKKYKVKLCVVSALMLPIVLLIGSRFSNVLLILQISFLLAVIEAVVLLVVPYLLALEPYIVLMRYLRKQKIKKTDSEVSQNNKNDKRSTNDIDSESQKDNIYEKEERIIKAFVRLFVNVVWVGGTCILSILFIFLEILFISMLTDVSSLGTAVFTGIGIFVIGMFIAVWNDLRKNIIGDHSCYLPINIAGKKEKYSPEKLLRKLKNNRSNVVLLKSKQGQVRIYGRGNTHVLEIRMGKEDDLTVFHMINTYTDSIMPVTDNTPTVIKNKWYEKFPVRKHWLVDGEVIVAFLTKLYINQDIQTAMEGFSFEDTTEEINRLIKNDAYIVPEIPVDWPVGGINSNMGQAWMRRKEARVQRALEVLSET